MCAHVCFLFLLPFSEYIEQSKEQARVDKEKAAKKHRSPAEEAKIRELAKKRKGGRSDVASHCRAADITSFVTANVRLTLLSRTCRGEVSQMPWLSR